jgi:hypothetical protein
MAVQATALRPIRVFPVSVRIWSGGFGPPWGIVKFTELGDTATISRDTEPPQAGMSKIARDAQARLDIEPGQFFMDSPPAEDSRDSRSKLFVHLDHA